MNEEGRREIPEWVTLLALLLALALAPLPFVTEDRYFRVLPGALLFIFPLIMLLATMFPRGLRLHLGFVVLRIAPPAAYFVSYYSARRWLEDVRNDFVGYAAELNGIKSEQDALTADVLLLHAQIADEIGIDSDPTAKLATDMFFAVYTDNDAALGAAADAALDVLRKELHRPPAPTAPGILNQVADIQRFHSAALVLLKTRIQTLRTFTDITGQRVLQMTSDALADVEQRAAATVAQIAAIEETAEVGGVPLEQERRRGRKPKYSAPKVQQDYEAYSHRPASQSADDFARAHGYPTRKAMYDAFRRYCPGWRKSENSE